MTPQELRKLELEKARKLIKKLRTEIGHHEKCYRAGRSEISDFEFDGLMAELKGWEERFPELKEALSPTNLVGDDRGSDFPKADHLSPMLSLDNSYSSEELLAFEERLLRALGMAEGALEYVVEPKIDGVGISVVYRDGKLAQAVTRGDGQQGDVVTENFKTIVGVPLELPQDLGAPALFELRGEVYLTHAQFERINADLKAKNALRRAQNTAEAQSGAAQKTLFGEDCAPANLEKGLETEYANPRNLAAGTLKLKDDVEEVRRRGLKVIFYAVGDAAKGHWATHVEFLEFLKKGGWPTQEFYVQAKGHPMAWEKIQQLDALRKNFAYPTDGAVLKLNSYAQQKEAGYTSRSPRWAFAYKYKPDEAETLLKEITIQVGRTGVLTPVAELEPIELSGSTIARVTLHNADEIERKDIRVGDTVLVEKAGEVIPKIIRVVLEKRPENSRAYVFPQHCPECRQMAVRYPEEVAWRCVNEKCPGRLKRALEHFASRNAMTIDELGEKVVEALVDSGKVKKIPDLYTLGIADLLMLPGFAQKSALNLYNAIASSKQNDLWRLLNALGIPQVGQTVSELLASEFGDLHNLASASKEQLESIHGIGESMAESIAAYFHNEEKRAEIEQLIKLGLNTVAQAVKKSDGPLKGQKWVLTGELAALTRQQAKAALEALGATVVDNVSKNTTALVAGEAAGSKLQKAQQLSVRILNEAEFLKLIKP